MNHRASIAAFVAGAALSLSACGANVETRSPGATEKLEELAEVSLAQATMATASDAQSCSGTSDCAPRGAFLVAGGAGTIYASDGASTYCALSDSRQYRDYLGFRTDTNDADWKRYARLDSLPSKMTDVGACKPSGTRKYFWVKGKGSTVYLSDGASYCHLNSVAHYVDYCGCQSTNGVVDWSGVETANAFPAAQKYTGECIYPYRFRYLGATYRSDGAASYCRYPSDREYMLDTGEQNADGTARLTYVQTYATLPKSMVSAGDCPIFQAPIAPTPVPTPTYQSEIPIFEDNFLSTKDLRQSLTYRYAGAGTFARVSDSAGIPFGRMTGAFELVHPAQYQRATLRLKLKIESGNPQIAISHNGTLKVSGQRAPSPGLAVELGSDGTRIIDLATTTEIAFIAEVFPRNQSATLSVFWDFVERRMRVDMPSRESYFVDLPATLKSRGGFGIRSSVDGSMDLAQIQVLWQDDRRVAFYDLRDSIHLPDGRTVPLTPPTLPNGYTSYHTVAYDLRYNRSLIAIGNQDLDLWNGKISTIKAYAVRDLLTGSLLSVFGPSINGCQPSAVASAGGGGFDGIWLTNAPVTDGYVSNLCWIDWNLYDLGDSAFVFRDTRYHAVSTSTRSQSYTDPANALDGSVMRFLSIDQTWKGTNYLGVHPDLQDYRVSSGDRAFPAITTRYTSHTGPGGFPTQLAVRDKDRAWYEEWAYQGSGLHTRNLGLNLFNSTLDFSGPNHQSASSASVSYDDWCNPTPSLQLPGVLTAQYFRWKSAAPKIEHLRNHWLGVSTNAFSVLADITMAASKQGIIAQILWEY